ncbi:MAG: radical SAM protein [Armatimonadota bacterium]
MWKWEQIEPQAEQVCRLCGTRSRLIAGQLSLCLDCIREQPEKALAIAAEAHAAARRLFDLPERPPRAEDGRRCGLCVQDCVIGEDERGFCGLREVRDGRLHHLAGTADRGLLHWYRDNLPTNCVADPVCAGHARRGRHNLAVFYASCTIDCLFCQNYHFREVDPAESDTLSAEGLAVEANERTYCVCFFGGDPASQMPHALAAGRCLAERGIVVCWETNGTVCPNLMDRALDLALETGGCVKFDLKAHDDTLHRVLTSASNRHTLKNVARAAARFDERPEPPPVVVSTLLVPGYVDADEVSRVARFIAEQHPSIPYVLLGFAPHFLFPDLPRTSVRHAEAAEAAAREAGLQTVRVGNRHLLSRAY